VLLTVPEVKPSGPNPSQRVRIFLIQMFVSKLFLPIIPSTPLNPVAVLASPIDCDLMVNPEPKLTSSVYSSPEKDPLP